MSNCASVFLFSSLTISVAAFSSSSELDKDKTLERIVLNSNSSNNSFKSFVLKLLNFTASSSKSIGTLVIIVANCFDCIPCSLAASTFSLNFPFISYVLANKPSIDPYCAINF